MGKDRGGNLGKLATTTSSPIPLKDVRVRRVPRKHFQEVDLVKQGGVVPVEEQEGLSVQERGVQCMGVSGGPSAGVKGEREMVLVPCGGVSGSPCARTKGNSNFSEGSIEWFGVNECILCVPPAPPLRDAHFVQRWPFRRSAAPPVFENIVFLQWMRSLFDSKSKNHPKT